MHRFLSFLLLISLAFAQEIRNIEISNEELKSINKAANPHDLDYNSLDEKYYKYIKSFNIIYDKDIKKLIKNVNLGEIKSGIFIATHYGANASKNGINPTLIGASVGLDNFKGLVLMPSLMGYSIYIDYIHSFLTQSINLASINLDLLMQKDFNKDFSLGFSVGFGVGSGDIDTGKSLGYDIVGRINYSVDFRFMQKNTLRLMINAIGNLRNNINLNVLYMLGYKYVF